MKIHINTKGCVALNYAIICECMRRWGNSPILKGFADTRFADERVSLETFLNSIGSDAKGLNIVVETNALCIYNSPDDEGYAVWTVEQLFSFEDTNFVKIEDITFEKRDGHVYYQGKCVTHRLKNLLQ